MKSKTEEILETFPFLSISDSASLTEEGTGEEFITSVLQSYALSDAVLTVDSSAVMVLHILHSTTCQIDSMVAPSVIFVVLSPKENQLNR